NGEPPFGRESTTIAGHVDMPAPPLRMTAPDVSAELGAVLARGLARDPAERPRSAGELAAAFLGVVAGRPGSEVESSPLSPTLPREGGGQVESSPLSPTLPRDPGVPARSVDLVGWEGGGQEGEEGTA